MEDRTEYYIFAIRKSDGQVARQVDEPWNSQQYAEERAREFNAVANSARYTYVVARATTTFEEVYRVT